MANTLSPDVQTYIRRNFWNCDRERIEKFVCNFCPEGQRVIVKVIYYSSIQEPQKLEPVLELLNNFYLRTWQNHHPSLRGDPAHNLTTLQLICAVCKEIDIDPCFVLEA